MKITKYIASLLESSGLDDRRIDRSRADLGLTDEQKEEVRKAGASWAKYSQYRLAGKGHKESVKLTARTGR